MTYSFTAISILRLEPKIVNQLSRRITNSLFSLECLFYFKNGTPGML